MTTPSSPIANVRHEEEPVQAWLTDIEIDERGRRFTFIRLVPRGSVMPANGYTGHLADIDIDGEGNIIGITIPLWEGPTPADLAALAENTETETDEDDEHEQDLFGGEQS